jgi:hypothetical protein
MATAAATTEVTSTTTVVDVRTRLAESADARIEEARGFQVTDSNTYRLAADKLLTIKALRGEVDEAFDPIIADAHRAHKTGLAQKAKVDGPLAEAEELYKIKMGAYDDDQRRIQREEERRRREQVERQAAEDREREIEDAEKHGATIEEIIVIAEAPLRVAPVIVSPAVPKVAGISSRENWKWEVEDKLKLDRFVAANPMYSNLTSVNSAAVTAWSAASSRPQRSPASKSGPKATSQGGGAKP